MSGSGRGSQQRRRRILDAALRLALLQGQRATTMEAIAGEAQVAKPTLYAYFADKAAVYEGVADLVVAEVMGAVNVADAGGGDMVDRVGAMLAARHRAMARIVGQSPHAEALQRNGHMLVPLARVEQQLGSRIVAALDAAGVRRPLPLASLVIAAADGVSRRAGSTAEIGPAVRLLAERLIRPEIVGGRKSR